MSTEAAVRVRQVQDLVELVTCLYEECGQEVIPTYPRVLVRVLPREQQKSGIILPEHKQNKPTWEAIVLRTYEPFWRPIDRLVEGIPEECLRERVEPVVKPGDHVLFPHIAEGITPVWPLDGGVGNYRLVPEQLLHSRVEYQQQKLVDELLEYFDSLEPTSLHQQLEEFLKHYDVLRKDISSKTISGR